MQKPKSKSLKDCSDKELKKYKVTFSILGSTTIFIGLIMMPIGIFFILLGLYSLFMSYACAHSLKERTDKNVAKKEKSMEDITEKALRRQAFEKVEDGNVLKYQYNETVCTIDFDDFDKCRIGGSITFVQEKNNPHDDKAIAMYSDNVKLGYVYRGKTQDMINSWINRNDYFRGYIFNIEHESKKIYYKIGFYKSLDNYNNEVFSLRKTSKKLDDIFNRQDSLSTCKSGSEVYLEYSDNTETYVVTNYTCDEIGELDAATSKMLLEKEDEGTILYGIVDMLTVNDNEQYNAKIRVYYLQ